MIRGTGFAGATAVDFGSTPGTIVSVSPTTIYATAPPGTASSTVNVRVVGPGGTSIVDSADQFTYGPAIKYVSPSSGSAGTTVTLKGAGFSDSSMVSFGGVPATVVSVDSLGRTMTVTAPAGAAGSTVDVTVTTGDTTSLTSSTDQFTYK